MVRAGQAANGKLGGTPAYLPPEVIRGGAVTAASDLYSVGCLAFEMLTGQLPFEGRPIEVLRAHASNEPPRLRTLRPDAPEALEAIVGRLLAKDPAMRHPHAAAVIDDLAKLAGLAIARPDPAQQQSYLVSSVLVGRELELARLTAARALADIPDELWGWVSEVSRRTPVLLCLEVLHWADEATVATLNRGLGHLSEGARRLAWVAAVIGRDLSLNLLLAVSSPAGSRDATDEERLFASLDELLAAVHRVPAVAVPPLRQEERWHYLRALQP